MRKAYAFAKKPYAPEISYSSVITEATLDDFWQSDETTE